MMPKQYSGPPAMQIDANKTYTARFNTNKGEFDIELFAAQAPITINNFVFLARDGFYPHRRIHAAQIPGLGCFPGADAGPAVPRPAAGQGPILYA